MNPVLDDEIKAHITKVSKNWVKDIDKMLKADSVATTCEAQVKTMTEETNGSLRYATGVRAFQSPVEIGEFDAPFPEA